MIRSIILGLIFVASVHSLYSPSDEVVILNANNFNSKVIQSDDVWLVEFYAPWCGHCKNLAPEWQKAAKALKGIAKLGAVDMDDKDAQSVGSPYGIRGFPTIKVFAKNKNSPTDYQGGRTAQAIIDEAINQLKIIAKERLTGGSKSSGSGSSGQKKSDDVIELTDANFEKTVLESDDIWLVEFFAPWCGHCKNLAPEWARAATELKGKVKLGALDATVHPQMAQRYGVQGYPTIKYFGAGAKTSPSDYDGGRTSADIVTWAMNKFAENAPAPDVFELTSQEKLDECSGKQICIIAFLPNLYDCQSKCRNKYLETLRSLADKFKTQVQWSWLWTASGEHKELEKSLSVGGFGFPALTAINARKGKYVLLKGSFGENGIREFLRDLSVGRGSTEAIPGEKLPTISASQPWDGMDAKMVEEEDIDLSDVDLDDDIGGFGFRKKSVSDEEL